MADPGAVEVRLDLSRHCVEAAAREEHRRLAAALMEEQEASRQEDLARRVELLHAFLSATDFRALRASDGRLAGGRPAVVVVRREGAAEPGWRLARQ